MCKPFYGGMKFAKCFRKVCIWLWGNKAKEFFLTLGWKWKWICTAATVSINVFKYMCLENIETRKSTDFFKLCPYCIRHSALGFTYRMVKWMWLPQVKFWSVKLLAKFPLNEVGVKFHWNTGHLQSSVSWFKLKPW